MKKITNQLYEFEKRNIMKKLLNQGPSQAGGFGIGMKLLLVSGGFLMVLSLLASSVEAQSTVLTQSLRHEYIDLEQSLWQYLGKNINQATQLKKVIDSHYKFINENPSFQDDLDTLKYKIFKSHEWGLLEKDLLEIDGYFQFFKSFMNRLKANNDYDERALLDFSESITRNDQTFSISRIFQDIHLIMTTQAYYYWSLTESTEQICQTQQSPQQFVYNLYTDIALTELKGYTMMEFSWMILRLYGKGNFTQEADLMRQDYEKRNERTIKLLKEVMRRADRVLYRCDPEKFIKGTNYDEVTRLLQGYIENEVDLNNDETCLETCSFYQNTRSEGCFKRKFCARQQRCHGRLYHCTFVDSDMWVCPGANNSTRRYEYIEYENGKIFGTKKHCTRGTTKVDSWWRYLFWHCSYCFCLCDEQGLKSDRYFNLRPYTSDIENNKIITGLRFVKHNRIFHLQIQEGDLMPQGSVNQSSVAWKPVHDYLVFDKDVRNGRDFHTLSFDKRSIDLDDVYTTDNSYIVTGVRFRLVGVHLNLEVRLTEFNFETGKLSVENTFWKSNDNTDVSGERREKINLYKPDVPTKTTVRSVPTSKHNQYLEFINTDMEKDAAQTTVPYVDIQDVVSKPAIPLSGVGLYHKGARGYGGFLGAKIITYDFAPHVMLPKSTK